VRSLIAVLIFYEEVAMTRLKDIASPVAIATAVVGIAACVVNPAPQPATPTTAATTAAPATPGTPATPATAAAATDPVPPQTPMVDPPQPAPSDTPAELRFTVADGRPSGLHPGVVESYWIWHEDHGRWWHVRTSTHSQLHHFTGWVWHDKDRFTDVKPTRLEWNDRIRYGEKGISWDFQTKGHEDGFSFKTNGAQCVRFHTFIDGKPAHSALVHIGAGGAHPPGNHFKLCP
jgi:hypothetical protein